MAAARSDRSAPFKLPARLSRSMSRVCLAWAPNLASIAVAPFSTHRSGSLLNTRHRQPIVGELPLEAAERNAPVASQRTQAIGHRAPQRIRVPVRTSVHRPAPAQSLLPAPSSRRALGDGPAVPHRHLDGTRIAPRAARYARR